MMKENFRIFETNDSKMIEKLIKNIGLAFKTIDDKKIKINIDKDEVPDLIKCLVENDIKIYEVKEEEKT